MNIKDKGFTLVELMIVVIVIGILSSIAIPNYLRTVEKGRSAEARQILAMIRTAENAYYFEWDDYTDNAELLSLDFPVNCQDSHYFRYGIVLGGDGYTAGAIRCERGDGGKEPGSLYSYQLGIDQDGVLTGTDGFL